MDEKKVYLNDCIVSVAEAKISIADAGFLHGASVFTTMLAHNGAVFRLDKHLDRLMAAAARFDLRTKATPDLLHSATEKLLESNGLSEARVRITLTPGAAGAEAPTTLITADELGGRPESWYTRGIKVVVSSMKQTADDITCGVKTGCYFPRVLARQAAAAKGADEALWFTQDNFLAEACFCNVMLVLGGKVHTPPLETPVLAGIVRQAVIELCGQLDIECDDATPLTVHDMLAAEEMFLTSSCSGVRPVVQVERHVIGDAKVGEITRRIMAAYCEMLDRECPPQAC